VTTRRPIRLKTFTYLGCERYFLTMCCRNRRRSFEHSAVVETARLELLRTSDRQRFAVLAYVFMPDHMHALVEGLEATSDLRRFLAVVRKRTTLASRFLVPGALWQDGYFERVLRESDEPGALINYILNNPVRSGLVDNPADYPFSWSCTLESRSRP
jgi:REP element-mobilizing transposase RayT